MKTRKPGWRYTIALVDDPEFRLAGENYLSEAECIAGASSAAINYPPKRSIVSIVSPKGETRVLRHRSIWE